MISCLGQQNVDGKRIPYGFDQRTLPHYSKFDDTPGARGFVESSYINGLTPQELFFHAMGGRVGLIDTAVKTSTTGYIQRRLVKGLEDLMVSYDMTIRTNKNKIVQFSYGEDNIDTTKVENQMLPIVTMSIQEIYSHYTLPDDTGVNKEINKIFEEKTLRRYKRQKEKVIEKNKELTQKMIDIRESIIKNVFKNKSDSIVNLPVAFSYLINNIQGQQNINSNSMIDLTPLEAYNMIDATFEKLQMITYVKPTELFKTAYYYYLSPKELLFVKRYNQKALVVLLDTIVLMYKRSIVSPGEMVGMTVGQSIGETSTQMTLNTFHFAGVAAKSNVTRGVPRIEEILSLSSDPKNPSLTVYLRPEDESDREKAQVAMYMLEHTKLKELVTYAEICFDPDDLNTLIPSDKESLEQYRAFENMLDECMEDDVGDDNLEKSKWIIRMEMDKTIMLEKNITMDDINYTLSNCYGDEVSCMFSDYNSDKLIFRIRMNSILKASKTPVKPNLNPLDQSDQIFVLKNFQESLLNNTILRGVKKINKVTLRRIKDNVVEEDGIYKRRDMWVLDTTGTNLLETLALDYVDKKRTFSNDIVETYNVLGIEAARQSIMNELVDVIEFDGTYINYHHFSILCDRMTFSYKMISIFRHGINNDNIGPIAKASFEETPEMFLKAARHGELDTFRGVSANIMCGQEGYYGTNSFQVVLDVEEMAKFEETSDFVTTGDTDKEIDAMFDGVEGLDTECSDGQLVIQNNVVSIQSTDTGGDNSYNPGF
jgi:DNA-directed RNA polymerase II subunit RPB1